MAGEIGGDLVVKFEAQVADFITKINKASTEFDKVQKKMGRTAKKSKEVVSSWKQLQVQGNQLYRTLFNIKTVALVAFGGIVTSVSKVVAETEKMKASLNVLTGGQGGQAFDSLSSWARTVNITTEEAVNTYKNFRSVGLQPTIKDMETILDLANAFGGGTDTIKRLTKAVGDIQAKGKLMGEEVRQLTNIGVPIRAILLESGALTTDMVNDIGRANISAQKVMSALFNYTENNFKGMTSEIMKTWAGTVMQMEDTWWRMKLTIGENMVENGVGQAGKNFNNPSETRQGWLASFGRSLGNTIAAFDDLADGIDSAIWVIAKLAEVITASLRTITHVWGDLSDGAVAIIEEIGDVIGGGLARAVDSIMIGIEKLIPDPLVPDSLRDAKNNAIIRQARDEANLRDPKRVAHVDAWAAKMSGDAKELNKMWSGVFEGGLTKEQKNRFANKTVGELPDAGGMISGYKNLDEVINSIEAKFNNLKKKVPQTYEEMRKGADDWAEAQKKAINAYLPDSKLSKSDQETIHKTQFEKIEEVRKLMQEDINRAEAKKSAGIIKDIDTQLAKNKRSYFDASRAYDAYIQNLKDSSKVSPEFFENNKEKLKEFEEMLYQREDLEKESYRRRTDALYDYAKENETAFSNIGKLTTDMISSLEDTLTDFFMTGKAGWSDYLDTISRMIMKSMIQQMITAPLAGGLSDLFGSFFGGVSNFEGQAPGAVGPFLPQGSGVNKASGGMITEPIVGYGANTHKTYRFGEAGNEMITPSSMFNKLGNNNGTNVKIEVVNRSGTPVQAKQTYQTTTAGDQVIQVVLDALSRNKSGLRDQIRSI